MRTMATRLLFTAVIGIEYYRNDFTKNLTEHQLIELKKFIIYCKTILEKKDPFTMGLGFCHLKHYYFDQKYILDITDPRVRLITRFIDNFLINVRTRKNTGYYFYSDEERIFVCIILLKIISIELKKLEK